ncbi:cytochrome P450, partial [Moraxella catarrhalis]|uniref:cytochrome P450 n=1 Tax=Moraxella catarrhalis TaxID=480 RepID=UPI00128DB9FD
AQLPYLNAVVNESLRIAPPVVIGVPRVVPAGGATICGRYVPAGVSRTVHVSLFYRNLVVF